MVELLTLVSVSKALLSPIQEINAAIEAYTHAVIAYDVSTLDRLFATDYMEVSPLGDLDSRSRTLSFYGVPFEQRGPAPTQVNVKDLSVRFAQPTVAIAIYREEIQILPSGTPVTTNFRITSVLTKQGNGWQFLSNHATSISK